MFYHVEAIIIILLFFLFHHILQLNLNFLYIYIICFYVPCGNRFVLKIWFLYSILLLNAFMRSTTLKFCSDRCFEIRFYLKTNNLNTMNRLNKVVTSPSLTVKILTTHKRVELNLSMKDVDKYVKVYRCHRRHIM